jgi:hypothetical protein
VRRTATRKRRKASECPAPQRTQTFDHHSAESIGAALPK